MTATPLLIEHITAPYPQQAIFFTKFTCYVSELELAEFIVYEAAAVLCHVGIINVHLYTHCLCYIISYQSSMGSL